MFEKIIFSKVEVWLVAVLLVLFSLGTVCFGWLVQHRAFGGQRFSVLGDAALEIAKTPGTIRRFFSDEPLFDMHEKETRFDLPSGFTFKRPIGSPNYVLLPRYDGDPGFRVVELFRAAEVEPLHPWNSDKPAVFELEAQNPFLEAAHDTASHTMRVFHPWLGTNGNLTMHFLSSPLYQLDACSNLIWMNEDFAYHHSIEPDADGNFWVPGMAPTKINSLGFDKKMTDDHLVQVAGNGDTLFSKSVLEILIENNLINRIYVYDQYQTDPIHLNDIQPVLSDGPHWKRGDVFLSIGHLNMLMLYRPKENKLVWWTQDRIMHQHDIDLIDDSRISVYDNRRTTDSKGLPFVIGHNDLLLIDIQNGNLVAPWREAFSENDIRTPSEGLSDIVSGEGLLIEETDYGRLIKLNENKETEWLYINKNSSGKTYILNWSRYISKEFGDQSQTSLRKAKCNE